MRKTSENDERKKTEKKDEKREEKIMRKSKI